EGACRAISARAAASVSHATMSNSAESNVCRRSILTVKLSSTIRIRGFPSPWPWPESRPRALCSSLRSILDDALVSAMPPALKTVFTQLCFPNHRYNLQPVRGAGQSHQCWRELWKPHDLLRRADANGLLRHSENGGGGLILCQ